MRRFLNDRRQFQSDRWLRAEVLRDGFDEAHIGIADAHRVIKGLVDDNRVKSQTIQTQLFGQVGQASPVAPGLCRRRKLRPGGAGGFACQCGTGLLP